MDKEVYALGRKEVIENVVRGQMGNYWLGFLPEGWFRVKWVGRSLAKHSIGLQKRLLDHASEGKYTHFKFRVGKSIAEVYNIECREFHRYRDQLDNKRHPDSPRMLHLRCQYYPCNIDGLSWDLSTSEGGEIHG